MTKSYFIRIDPCALAQMSDEEAREWLSAFNIHNVTDEELAKLRSLEPK